MTLTSLNRRMLNLTALAALSLSLAACGGGGLKDALGYGKEAPDEFAVVTKAPLVIPPDFALRPPQPGAPRPQEVGIRPEAGAQAALLGDAAKTDGAAIAATPGQAALLDQTGAAQADPSIRQVVNAENRSLVEKDDSVVDDVLFWRDKKAPAEPTVDPTEEQKRIQKNDAQGKPVTEGDTPVEKPRKEGWFSGIF